MSIISYDSYIYKAYSTVLYHIGAINWNWLKTKVTGKRYYNLTDADLQDIRQALSKNYFIINTRRNTAFSTYLIAFANFVKTGSFGHYDHVLLNLEDDNPNDDVNFQLYESTAKGSHISTFMEVFDCDSVALLRPKNVSIDEWHYVLDQAKLELGKPYDDIFQLNDDTHLSCVELVRNALKKIPDYEKKFPNLEKAIAKAGNLTPQMYYECEDFEVVYEVRR